MIRYINSHTVALSPDPPTQVRRKNLFTVIRRPQKSEIQRSLETVARRAVKDAVRSQFFLQRETRKSNAFWDALNESGYRLPRGWKGGGPNIKVIRQI